MRPRHAAVASHDSVQRAVAASDKGLELGRRREVWATFKRLDKNGDIQLTFDLLDRRFELGSFVDTARGLCRIDVRQEVQNHNAGRGFVVGGHPRQRGAELGAHLVDGLCA